MQGASPASSPCSSTSHPQSQPQMQKEKDASVLEGARICAVFARATAVVEQHHDNDAGGHGSSRPFFAFRIFSNQTGFLTSKSDALTERMNEATAFLARCKQLLSLSLDSYGDEDEDLRRAQSKVERALERLRRAAVKLLDAASREVEMGGVKAFLDGVVRVYEGFEVRDLV